MKKVFAICVVVTTLSLLLIITGPIYEKSKLKINKIEGEMSHYTDAYVPEDGYISTKQIAQEVAAAIAENNGYVLIKQSCRYAYDEANGSWLVRFMTLNGTTINVELDRMSGGVKRMWESN